jgi:translation initiation factor IF-2
MIVAINKCDKDGANPQRIRERCSSMKSSSRKWAVTCRTLKSRPRPATGLDDLLEKLALQAELMELKRQSRSRGRSVVVEAKLDKGRVRLPPC